jgi:hypothetical protein
MARKRVHPTGWALARSSVANATIDPSADAAIARERCSRTSSGVSLASTVQRKTEGSAASTSAST